MSPFNWSPKQKAAIEALNTNVLVSASAGAGKTTVLIGRLLKRMTIDRISLDEVVAITFTELAATEMRKRLAMQLAKAYDETKDEHIAAQLSLLPSAHISTIHAFCLKLIENYAYVIDLDPQQAKNVLDEASKLELLDLAFNEALKQEVAQDPIGLRDLGLHFDRKPENTTQLKTAVIAMMSKMNTLKDPKGWIQKSIQQLDASTYHQLSPDIKTYLDLFYAWKIVDLIDKAQNAVHIAQTDATYQNSLNNEGRIESNLENYAKTIERVEKLIQALSDELVPLLSAFDYATYREKLMSIHQKVGFNKIPKPDASKPVDKAWASLDAGYHKMIDLCFEEGDWFGDHAILKQRMQRLGDLSESVSKRYKALKKARNVIDFDDMEHLALDILKDTQFNIAQQFKDRIQEIMVDEFQDTNEIQNELVELISNGHNIFRVGDVKQSIYRFRNAQPQLMQRLMQLEDDTHTVLYLDENYRSSQSIVDFNNVLFDQLMNFAELNSRYQENDYVKTGTAKQAGGAAVEVHFLKALEDLETDDVEPWKDLDESSGSDQDDPDAVDVSIQMEKDEYARPKVLHIVNTILKLKHQPNSDYPNYRDYVVLVRSNQEKALLKEAFEKANIPHHISTKSGFYNAAAVQDVLLMLNVLVNPYDDLNFIGLCLSDFIGMNENQVAQLAIHKDKRPYVHILKERFPEVHAKIEQFRQTNRSRVLSEILRNIYRFNDYYDRFCSKQGRVNLDYLFEKAVQYTQTNISVSEFVVRMKNLDDSESSEAIPFTEEDNVVRVMTIHQSKGLEFKVVFYFTRLSGSVADNKTALLMDGELGYMLKTLHLPQYHARNNPIRLALEMKNTMDDVMEQVRLMYVALTRAEKKLIIVDSAPIQKDPLKYTSILNAIGSTRMLNAALDRLTKTTHTQVLFKQNPEEYGKLDEEIIESKPFNPKAKPFSPIEFKTPSSTHASFKNVKLNFNAEIGTNHGTQIHALFENMPLSDWTEQQIRSLDPNVTDKDVQSLMSFYRSLIYQRMIRGTIKKEFAFHNLYENVVLHGYMDLISVLDLEVILVDYKTDRVQDPQELNELYRDQLLGYAKVLKRMYPAKTIETYAYSVEHQVFVKIQ